MVTMMTDPIADMLTRIRNASRVGKPDVVIPSSKLKEQIAKILVNEGFIESYEIRPAGPGNELVVRLKYAPGGGEVIQGLKRLSSPGRRVYRKATELPRSQGGLGLVIVSTSQGLLPDREARRRKLGGELICEVW